MYFNKIAGPMRIDWVGGGQIQAYALDARGGGRMCKVVQVMVKVINSGGTGAKVGVDVEHGPDGQAFDLLQGFAAATVPASKLYVFNVDTTKIIGEYIRVIVKADGGAGDSWSVVEVFEMRKPF